MEEPTAGEGPGLALRIALASSESGFRRHFGQVNEIAHATSRWKGWWDGGDQNDGQLIALCHSELSELLEGLRHGNPPSEKIGGQGFSQAEEEAADVVIRLMDMAGARGWDLAGAILAKMAYNQGRPHRHGGKKF